MLTGLYPLEHGILTPRTALPDDVHTLAAMLHDQGFETAAVVNSTWLKQSTYGVTREFDAFLAVDDADYGRRTPSTWVTDQIVEWVRAQGDAPLFVFAHYYDVHADYASMPAYESLFVTPYEGPADGTGWQLQIENFDPRHLAYCAEEHDPRYCRFGSTEKPRIVGTDTTRVGFDAADVRHLEELYDAGVRQLDAEIGRLLAKLDDLGVTDRTLVVVTADHGEEFMEHGRVEHFLTAYQEMLHVPLILRGPGVPAGLRVRTPVSLVDVAPTILSLAGAPVPSGLDGVDLVPLLRGGADDDLAARPIWAEATGGEVYGPPLDAVYPLYRAVREGRFKLVHDARTGASALYDLASDPGERVDVADEHPAVAARLEAILLARHAESAGSEPGGRAVELDPEERARLRALGYVP
jgi:arylsulfatase A-like enzyme